MSSNMTDVMVQVNEESGVRSSSSLRAQLIEKEYLNSMLNSSCLESAIPETKSVLVNYADVYKCDPIECTVFEIENINMALPRSIIRAILSKQEIAIDRSHLGHQEMIVGTVDIDNETVEIIDLACLVMNGVDNNCAKTQETDSISKVILLKGCSVGILYDEIHDDKMVSHDQVCWRNETSSRPWLAGTIAQMGFALIDVQGILALLNRNL